MGAGPGDPKLLTVRALEILGTADVVIYDRLVSSPILRLIPEHATKIYAGKTPRSKRISQEEINGTLISEARIGKKVVRLKGGDPFVFSRGGEEISALREAHVNYEVVPGVSSAIAAPAYAGIPLTHRKYSSSVAVVTGHEDRMKKEPNIKWSYLASSVDTIIILMGVASFEKISKELIHAGLKPDTPVAAIQWATTSRQRTTVFTLQDSTEISRLLKPPSVIVIGKVAKLAKELAWFPEQATAIGPHVSLDNSSTVKVAANSSKSRTTSPAPRPAADNAEIPKESDKIVTWQNRSYE